MRENGKLPRETDAFNWILILGMLNNPGVQTEKRLLRPSHSPHPTELGQTETTDNANTFLNLHASPELFYVLDLGHASIAINGYTSTNFNFKDNL